MVLHKKASTFFKFFKFFYFFVFSCIFPIGLGAQKATHNLVVGKLHKTKTAFVTLGEN